MKINKISVPNSFKDNKILKKISPVTIVSASALFATSKKEGVDASEVINEYYKNEFEMRNKKYNINNDMLSRFTPEERLEFLQMGEDLEIYSKALKNIINAKNENNQPRFNAEDSLFLFQEASIQIEDHPNLFKEILAVKDDKGNFKFNAQECAMLMQNFEIFQAYPIAKKTVFSKNLDAKNIKNIMLSIADILEDDKSILDEALNKLSQSKQVPIKETNLINLITEIDLRKQQERIQKIKEQEEQAAQQKFVLKYTNELERFSPEEIQNWLLMGKNLDKYSTAFSIIVNAKDDNKNPRFNAEDSLSLFQEACAQIERYPDTFKSILDAKDNNGHFRFNSQDCITLMQIVKMFRTYPKTKKVLLSKNIDAITLKDIMLNTGEILEKDTSILDEALSKLPPSKKVSSQNNILINLIKEISLERQKMRIEVEKEKERVAQQRKELKAAKLAEEQRIKQEKINLLGEQIGWVAPEIIFEKINKALEGKTSLILKSGEILPYEMVEKIAKHINKFPKKAQNIINLKYQNLQPIFNEKECLNILSEMDKYYCEVNVKFTNEVDEKGKPFFTPQQCRELLQENNYSRDKDIWNFMHSSSRQYNAEEIIELIKNRSVTTKTYWYPYSQFANAKNEQGEYKYSVSEAIELARINKRNKF